MSTRALALLALVLTLLVAATALVAADRLGWGREWERPGFTFTNPLLDARRWDRVLVRPMEEGQPDVRYTFVTAVTEPDAMDEFSAQPHIRVGLESREPDEEQFYYEGEQAFLYRQLGAYSMREWLEEIRPVLETRADGSTVQRLRVVFGHQSGGRTVYFYDPSIRVPGLGWIRQEFYAENELRHVLYASDAGRAVAEDDVGDGDGD